MLVWDEVDILTVLEVIPEVGDGGISHQYSVKSDGLELRILIFQYDGDARIELYRDNVEKSIFSMQIFDCPCVIRKNDSTGEYLEFAGSKSFGTRYDGQTSIPYGVRAYIKPSINVALF